MFALFLLLMEQHLLPEALHEWLGLSLFVLVLAHNALNYRWYAVLARGRYNALRAVRTAVDFLLWLAMIVCAVSSLMISEEVFARLGIGGAGTGRALHLVSTAWAFVLMSVHLGLHTAGFAGRIKRVRRRGLRIAPVWILRAAVLAVCACGIYVFIDRAFYQELFLLTQFKEYDYRANALLYLAETASMSVLFAGIAHYARKAGLAVSRRRKEAKK